MADHSQTPGHDAEHGTRGAATSAAAHRHGEMDMTEHYRTFEGFIRFWIWLFGISAGVLIFLALFNS